MYSSNTYATPSSHQAQQNYQSQSQGQGQSQFAQSASSSSSFNSPQYQPFAQSQASSPFGSSQTNQSSFGQQQYGGGYGGGQQPGFGHGQQGALGGQTKASEKRYMLGYLSSGIMAQPDATPPKNGADDSNMRSWDSPTNRASITGASPLARGAIFANNTPSRSSASAAPSDLRGGYGAEMEDNGPPMQSLSDFDGADASMSFSSADATAATDARRPPLASTQSTQSTQSFSSIRPSATTPSPTFAADVFGFPAAATSAVIELLRECGDIVKATPADGGNWVTLHFADAVSVRRAARKNGQTVPWQGGLVMIGVKATDEDALNAAMNATDPAAAGSVPSGDISRVGTPARGARSVALGEGTAFKTAAPTPPRRGFFGGGATPAADPHASLFAGTNQQAVMKQGEAQKGVTGKVMDLVFGWLMSASVACAASLASASSLQCLTNTTLSPSLAYPVYHIPREALLPNISDRHLSIAAPFIVYWTLSLCFELIDRSHLAIFERHRIHTLDDTRVKNRRVGMKQVIATVLFQQVLQTALGLVWLVDDDPADGPLRDHASDIARWSVLLRKGFRKVLGTVPAGVEVEDAAAWMYWWGVPALQLFVALVVLDAWQYFWHRVVHESNFLYRKIHSWHHLLYAPYAFGALYNHPLEGFLLDTFGAALAHSVARMTTRQGIVFFALSTAKTVDDHCGFKLPWDPFQILFGNSADYHDIHHQLGGFKKNYQQPWFQYLDYFLGTQITRAEFEALKAARKQRLHPKLEEKVKDSDSDDERADPNLVQL